MRRLPLKQIYAPNGKNASFIVNLSKKELWVDFGFFVYSSIFYNKMTHEARHLPSLCRLNLLKLVCIRAIPNNSRMLPQSILMKIRFWKRKKSNSTLIFAFFTLQWDISRFFFFNKGNNSVLLRKKLRQVWHLHVSKHAVLPSNNCWLFKQTSSLKLIGINMFSVNEK